MCCYFSKSTARTLLFYFYYFTPSCEDVYFLVNGHSTKWAFCHFLPPTALLTAAKVSTWHQKNAFCFFLAYHTHLFVAFDCEHIFYFPVNCWIVRCKWILGNYAVCILIICVSALIFMPLSFSCHFSRHYFVTRLFASLGVLSFVSYLRLSSFHVASLRFTSPLFIPRCLSSFHVASPRFTSRLI